MHQENLIIRHFSHFFWAVTLFLERFGFLITGISSQNGFDFHQLLRLVNFLSPCMALEVGVTTNEIKKMK